MYKLLVLLGFISTSLNAQHLLSDYRDSAANQLNTPTRATASQVCSGNLLLDQAPNQSNGLFSDLDCDFCGGGGPPTIQIAAENFNLAAANTIGQFVIFGGYFPDNIPLVTDDWTLTLYQDNAGLPGTVVYTETNIPTVRTDTGVDLFGVDEYSFLMTPTTPIALAAGTYWVEVFNNSVANTDSVFWELGDTDTNSIANSAIAFNYPGPTYATRAFTYAMQVCQEAFDLDVNVTGLAATNTVTVTNAKDVVPVSADGITTISSISDAAAYNLSISVQPDTPNQVCTVTSGNATGNMTSTGVTVDINCVTTQYDVDINVTGLAATNSVSFSNGSDTATFNADGTQTISTLDDESTYDVDITVQPDTPNQVCSFDTADAGTLAGSDVTINVSCVTTQYDVNINVTGLAATNSLSFSNGADSATFNADGSQTISTLDDESAYDVDITVQPDTPNQVCSFVSADAGNLAGSDVTINVTCTTTQYDVDINVTGLAATNSVSFNNGADSLTINTDGTQTISTLDDESAYDVDITAQPDTPDQVCSFDTADSGTLAGSDVTINVSCVTTQYTVGVSVTGLAAGNSVVFQNNGGDNLTLNADGSDTFATALDDGSAYAVTVFTQPTTPNQTCVVAGATGNLNGSNVVLSVNCSTTQYDVNINVSGLAATNSVSFSNGADSLTINTDGTQTISTLDDESVYDVDITAQPDTPDQVCSFDTADSGTLAGSDVTINVNCVTTQYTVGVSVTGLAAGNSVVFQNNGGDNLTLNADGSDTFATALDDGSAYAVTVFTQPTTPNQTCVVSGATGNLNGSNVVLSVSCSTTQYDVNIAVTGLAATNSVSFSNGADSATFNADGTQTISTLDDESAYNLAFTAQPDTPNQVCIFDDPNSGTLAGADVTVNVSCSTTQYYVNIAVSGLVATNSVSFSNGADSATFNADGTQTISTLDDESAYNLAITAQPDTPNQVCIFDDPSSGTLAGADVTVNVSCSTTQYDVNINVTGLAATNSVSFSNGADSATFNADGTQTISTLDDESAYNLAITTQPDTPNQVCSFDDSTSGTLAGADVTVNVSCTTTQYNVNLNVSGLASTNSVSFSNGADTATFNADGTQTISTLDDETAFNLVITAQPDTPNQVCIFDDPSSGTLAGDDVTINVSCETTQYDVNINVVGLSATNSVSFSNGADSATFNADGTQTISTLDDESAYDVDITVQPDTPNQVCTFDTADAGTLAGSDVTINVSCTTTQYDVNINVTGLAATNSVSFSNGADSATFNADGTQTISTLDDESAFDVDITVQPDTPNQVCTFDTADAGTLAGSDVTINVSCTTTQYDVNINVTGLAATNSVSFSNGADSATFNTDGSQTISTLDDESAYNLAITAQPDTPNQVCIFDDPNSGTLAGADVTVNVSCSTTQYDVNINVVGLSATNSVSFSNGADSATFNVDGTQTISSLDDESAYDVDITLQPDTPDQVCTFDTADAGTLAGSDVTINVSCTTTQYDVNIAVTGLAATNLVSFSNGADTATFNVDGSQTISTLDDESAYNLVITAQPDTPDQVCSFDNPNSGTLAGADVTIIVSCTTTQYDVNINVTGLAATNSVSFSNGADAATFNADGLQTISTLDDESAYDVDITVQPDTPNQVCTFDTADAGTLAGADVTVNVTCVTTQYDVNIAVTGLAASNSVSFSNGVDTATFNADGTQTISTLDDETTYNVAITAQPNTPDQVCTFDNANAGSLAGSDVTVNVTCVTTQYDVNIAVTGLAATNSVSFSNGVDTATFNADGTQTISTLDDETTYNVAITAQPNTPDQVCTFDNANAGSLAGSDVTVNVTCVTTQYDVNIVVTGLAATNSVSFSNGADTATFNVDGTQTISTLDDESAFNVAITAQPNTPDQVCTFDNANADSLAGSDVTVNVTCVTTQYDVNIAVTGLAATNSVSFSNGVDTATFNADGTQTISTLDDESAFNVLITTQPDTPDQVCTFDDQNSGALAGSDVTVNVTCVTTQYDVNIVVTGLAATNSVSFSNGADTVSFNVDGTQTISTLDDESAFNVAITAQPNTPDQVCTFDNANSGALAGSDVTVNVTCVTTQYDVLIAVTGLAATNSVSFSNGADSVTFNADGTQTISTLDDESAYDVDITVQPDTPNQVCSFDSADAGSLAGSDVTVNVSCVTTQYDVGVTVTGLAPGNAVVLQNNGGDDLTINVDGSANFATALDDGSAYAVTVLTEPTTPNQTCVITAPTGNLAGNDVNLTVTCTINSYAINVEVTGLATDNEVILQNNAGDDLTIDADGTSTFATALLDETDYEVTVLTQPTTPNQTCVLENATGTLAGADVVDITLTCTINQYDINLNVSGLALSNSVGFSNGSDTLNFITNGTQTISSLDDESAFDVDITFQPDTPNQICTFIDSDTGVLAGEDITINVACVTVQYTVGVNVSGLAAGNSVTLQNNATDDLSVSADGISAFATPLDDGTTYNVTVLTQPTAPNQTCVVTNPSGNLNGSNVTLDVTCTTEQYTVSANVTGLAAGNDVVLQNNGGDDLSVSADGLNAFATALDDESAYAVTVLTQPTTPSQTCEVTDGTGNLAGTDVTVDVNCSIDQYTISVDVSGLAVGNDVVLQNNAGDDLTINANGSSTFATALDDETDYLVSVLTQPTEPNQTCVLSNESGTLAGADVTDVTLTCTTEQYDIILNVTGLLASNSVSFENGADVAAFNADGSQTITTADDGTAYDVDITVQPDTPDQICTFDDPDTGNLSGADVTIEVSCEIVTYDIEVDVTGLAVGNSVTLQNNGGDDLMVSSNGISTFFTPLDDATDYDVTVLTQPTSPNQTCVVTNGAGTVAGGDVTDITVACTTETYFVGGYVTGMLSINEVVLENNGLELEIVGCDGPFVFETPQDDLTDYDVQIILNPNSPPQACQLFMGDGTINGDDVIDVEVVCAATSSTDYVFSANFDCGGFTPPN